MRGARRAAFAALAAGLAVASLAQPPRADMWAAFAEILARAPPGARQVVDEARIWLAEAGDAVPGWDRDGVDIGRLLAALPGGVEGNVLQAGAFDAELLTNRPAAEIVPAGWTRLLSYGEIDLHPRHDAILFIFASPDGHVLLSRARHWRQGTASCWGPIRGVAVYRPATGPAADLAAIEIEVAVSFAASQGQVVCERFEGDLARGLTRTMYRPDGRPFTTRNRLLAGFPTVARPLAALFADD